MYSGTGRGEATQRVDVVGPRAGREVVQEVGAVDPAVKLNILLLLPKSRRNEVHRETKINLLQGRLYRFNNVYIVILIWLHALRIVTESSTFLLKNLKNNKQI